MSCYIKQKYFKEKLVFWCRMAIQFLFGFVNKQLTTHIYTNKNSSTINKYHIISVLSLYHVTHIKVQFVPLSNWFKVLRFVMSLSSVVSFCVNVNGNPATVVDLWNPRNGHKSCFPRGIIYLLLQGKMLNRILRVSNVGRLCFYCHWEIVQLQIAVLYPNLRVFFKNDQNKQFL